MIYAKYRSPALERVAGNGQSLGIVASVQERSAETVHRLKGLGAARSEELTSHAQRAAVKRNRALVEPELTVDLAHRRRQSRLDQGLPGQLGVDSRHAPVEHLARRDRVAARLPRVKMGTNNRSDGSRRRRDEQFP